MQQLLRSGWLIASAALSLHIGAFAPTTFAQSFPLAIVYIAPDGDDALGCNSPATRCRTLRAGLAALANGGELRAAAGTYAGALTLRRDVTISGGFGLPEFTRGGGATIVNGGGRGSTLVVAPAVRVALRDLTISGGVAARFAPPGPGGTDSIGRGGGIYAVRADVRLERVVVTGNLAGDGGAGNGGGVAILGGRLTVIDSLVTGNTAARYQAGGATPGEATLVGRGGGVYARDSVVLIGGSTIASNQAVAADGPLAAVRGYGGGLYAERCEVEALELKLVSNIAVDRGAADALTPSEGGWLGIGGGARLANTRARLRGGELRANLGGRGGAVGRGGGAEVSGAHGALFDRVAVRDNAATEFGGGAGAGILLRVNTRAAPEQVALVLTNVLLAGQRGPALEAHGSGGPATVHVRHATLVANDDGLLAGGGGTISVVNSLLVDHTVAARTLDGGRITLRSTSRYANARDAEGQVLIGPDGDLALPPGFLPGSPAYQLAPGAPVADRGALLDDVRTDFELQPRSLDGDGDGVALPDLGWDEVERSEAAFGPSQALFARPGETVVATLELRNGGAADSFAITLDGPPGWAASVAPDNVSLERRRSIAIELRIQVPPDAPPYSATSFTVRASGATSAASTTATVFVGQE